jgi:superfamily II DNA/RNA helicase
LIGGVSFGDQDTKLTRGVDVLIATPGRLLDHTERGGLLLTGVELLVIDEADRMLDMGFIPDIERVCKMIPFTRQTLFFTATMPPEIRRITETFLHNPEKVEVARPATTAAGVSQFQVMVGREPHEKRETLRRLLHDAKDLQNAIIFCNRKREVALLHKSLQKHGFSVGALHGDMDQSARTQALDQFRKGEIPLLVASDVAARGLDIPTTSHVFNFDVPHHADDYVHRIGRTGRAGRAGTAISIVTPLDQKSMVAIEKLTGQTIPHAEGAVARTTETAAEASSEHSEQPREHRSREGSRGGRDKPRRESHEKREPQEKREPRRARGGRGHGAQGHGTQGQGSQSQQPAAEFSPPAAPQPSRTPSIGRAAPPVQREANSEPADHSHLPAFLLRPVRARV